MKIADIAIGVIVFVLCMLALVATSKGATGHRDVVNASYTRTFKAAYNKAHPKVPISKIACTDAISKSGFKYEDCLIAQRVKVDPCGEVFLSSAHPKNPTVYTTPQAGPCVQVKTLIKTLWALQAAIDKKVKKVFTA